MIENFRDVAHFAFVHKATLGKMPEVVEPLRPVVDGITVRMRRDMRAGEGSEEIWGSLREIEYDTLAPNFTSARMRMTRGERALLHCARAISATESVHYWVAGLTEEYDEHSMQEVIEAETRLYEEDRGVAASVLPPELPLAAEADVSTLADLHTLGYRSAFAEFVSRSLAMGVQARPKAI
jgi:hypothetical protein